jgi:CPA2 family monovalent cation:H+ antiporter-2
MAKTRDTADLIPFRGACMNDILVQVAIYLGAGLIAVPIAQRLGLGSVLGYLIAGIAIAPVLNWIGSDASSVQRFAEFGVVMMLFLVGLELQPSLLWRMRHRLFGLGGLQVLSTIAIATLLGLLLGLDWRVAIVVGMIISLSSTAIVLQTLAEKGWMRTDGGQASFSVLLFQDIAVIAMLALMPLLISPGTEMTHADGHGSSQLITQLPAWGQALATLGAVALVVVGGRYLTRPAFRILARTGLRELFSAGALVLVILITLLMGYVGLSAALGTFLAGVLLAESEYRHELVSDLEPFKGILLGVFFITVGAGIEFSLLIANPLFILGLTIAVVALKIVIFVVLAMMFGLRRRDRWMFALGLAQVGEFGFVLLGVASGSHMLPGALGQTLSLVVALSMLATPLLIVLFERVIAPRISGAQPSDRAPDEIDESAPVIIVGMGRFGQIVQRLLVMTGHKPVVLDYAADHIEGMRKFGLQVYYGDAMRPDLLESAGIASARLLVIAIADMERSVELVRHVKNRHPGVKIIARARSREHVYQLRAAGADMPIRELFGSSLEAATQSLTTMGYARSVAEAHVSAFAKHDEESLQQLFDVWDAELSMFDNDAYIEKAKSRNLLLADLMAEDAADEELAEEIAADPDQNNT